MPSELVETSPQPVSRGYVAELMPKDGSGQVFALVMGPWCFQARWGAGTPRAKHTELSIARRE